MKFGPVKLLILGFVFASFGFSSNQAKSPAKTENFSYSQQEKYKQTRSPSATNYQIWYKDGEEYKNDFPEGISLTNISPKTLEDNNDFSRNTYVYRDESQYYGFDSKYIMYSGDPSINGSILYNVFLLSYESNSSTYYLAYDNDYLVSKNLGSITIDDVFNNHPECYFSLLTSSPSASSANGLEKQNLDENEDYTLNIKLYNPYYKKYVGQITGYSYGHVSVPFNATSYSNAQTLSYSPHYGCFYLNGLGYTSNFGIIEKSNSIKAGKISTQNLPLRLTFTGDTSIIDNQYITKNYFRSLGSNQNVSNILETNHYDFCIVTKNDAGQYFVMDKVTEPDSLEGLEIDLEYNSKNKSYSFEKFFAPNMSVFNSTSKNEDNDGTHYQIWEQSITYYLSNYPSNPNELGLRSSSNCYWDFEFSDQNMREVAIRPQGSSNQIIFSENGDVAFTIGNAEDGFETYIFYKDFDSSEEVNIPHAKQLSFNAYSNTEYRKYPLYYSQYNEDPNWKPNENEVYPMDMNDSEIIFWGWQGNDSKPFVQMELEVKGIDFVENQIELIEGVSIYPQWNYRPFLTSEDKGAAVYSIRPEDDDVLEIVNGHIIKALAPGEAELTVTAPNGISGTTTVVVSQKKLISIAIVQLPKHEFIIGDNFEYDGLTIRLHYNNNTYVDVDSGFEVSSPDMSHDGYQDVTITYEGKTTKYSIKVWKKQPSQFVGIEVASLPNTQYYWPGDTFSFEGLTIRVLYSDENDNLIIDKGFSVSEPNMNQLGQQNVTVTYNEKTTSFGILIKTPHPIEFNVGESYDLRTFDEEFNNLSLNDIEFSIANPALISRNNWVLSGILSGNTILTITYLPTGAREQFAITIHDPSSEQGEEPSGQEGENENLDPDVDGDIHQNDENGTPNNNDGQGGVGEGEGNNPGTGTQNPQLNKEDNMVVGIAAGGTAAAIVIGAVSAITTVSIKKKKKTKAAAKDKEEE